MHVVGVMGVLFAVLDSEKTRRWWLVALAALDAVLITISTVFIKQHSVLDIYAGLVWSAAAGAVIYFLVKRLQLRHNKTQERG
jgi:membrane-associated phospholipid phosphatase